MVGGWFWGADPGISIRGGAMLHVLAGAWGPSIGPQQVQGSSPKMFLKKDIRTVSTILAALIHSLSLSLSWGRGQL